MFLLGVWWQHFHWRIGEASPWMAKQSIHGSDWQARFSAPLGNGERNEPLHTLEMDDSGQVVSVNRNDLELLEITGINPLGQVHRIRFPPARTVAESSCYPSGLRRSSEFMFTDGNGPSATGYLYYDAAGKMTGLDTKFGRARTSQAYETNRHNLVTRITTANEGGARWDYLLAYDGGGRITGIHSEGCQLSVQYDGYSGPVAVAVDGLPRWTQRSAEEGSAVEDLDNKTRQAVVPWWRSSIFGDVNHIVYNRARAIAFDGAY